MFENVIVRPPRRVFSYAAFSVVAHVAVVASVIAFASAKHAGADKVVKVAFYSARAMAPPPPPPPPAASHHRITPKKTVVGKIVQPKEIPQEKPKEAEPPAEPDKDDDGEEGGVEGGVVGGVKGGVVGGVLGGTVGGTGDTLQAKPKNVPPFVIQRDLLQQTPPRLSEVFKQSHRNAGAIAGMYKICVSTAGKVYEVTPLKSVPGADEDIIAGIKDGWLYKPQQVPVCFLYNIPITIR